MAGYRPWLARFAREDDQGGQVSESVGDRRVGEIVGRDIDGLDGSDGGGGRGADSLFEFGQFRARVGDSRAGRQIDPGVRKPRSQLE